MAFHMLLSRINIKQRLKNQGGYIMPKTHSVNSELTDSIAQNLFNALPIFRKRLLHMDVIQREYNIPLSHVQVLAMLNDNGSMSVSEISRRLGIAKPNITPLVDRLTESHLVDRQRDAEDRRVVNIVIRPEGAEKLGSIRTTMLDLVTNWADNLTVADLKELNKSLSSITRILGSINR
jgi:DNA-binding MarR family transcriptional regulator